MTLVGIDPSFTNTGIAIVQAQQPESVSVEFLSVGWKLEGKSFLDIYQAAVSRVDAVVDRLPKQVDIFITETPPSAGQFGSGLYALDTLLVHEIHGIYEGATIYGLNPNYLGHVHGTRKYHKSDSVALAKVILEKCGLTNCTNKKRLSSDEAEAFLFVSRVLVKKFPVLATKICSACERFYNEKEWKIY